MVRAAAVRLGGRSLMLALMSAVFAFYVAGPVYWLVKTSLEPEARVTAVPPTLLPQDPSLANFSSIFHANDRVTYENRRQADPATGNFVPSNARNLLPSLWNSLVVGLAVALLNIALSATAAYAIAVIKFRGRDVTLYSILVSRVIPDIALIVPLFLVMRSLGILDTRSGLVMTYLAVTVPFTTFILINYFRSIPVDLFKAARVDGCSHFGVLRHVYWPLAMPAIVASLMFAFLTSWNEFLFALIMTKSIQAQTLPIVISSFVLDFTINFSFVNAAGVLAIVPPVILAILFERYIVSGLTAGAVKG
ncbi:carbohydrate ABC transporter permease [Bradyrhizobium prioriisuperbiae]|uniref:carbohydrate ABC transporter permease n=1 Tax=Bradyrhizobium prioriisuperbiae TaxID=2854389 RepID=UPI0028EAA1F1|nr:carbohydrate ABC transporter permease [Bradyrhizobium prioritasuperba]